MCVTSTSSRIASKWSTACPTAAWAAWDNWFGRHQTGVGPLDEPVNLGGRDVGVVVAEIGLGRPHLTHVPVIHPNPRGGSHGGTVADRHERQKPRDRRQARGVDESPSLGESVLIGGDWNIGTWWSGGDRKYAHREGGFLSLLTAYGFTDLVDAHLSDPANGRARSFPGVQLCM